MSEVLNSQVFNDPITFNSILNLNIGMTTVNASISGNLTFSMPFQGSSYKKVVVYLNSFNGTGTITFPTPFVNVPAYMTNSDGLQSDVTLYATTHVNISSSGESGVMTFEGF